MEVGLSSIFNVIAINLFSIAGMKKIELPRGVVSKSPGNTKKIGAGIGRGLGGAGVVGLCGGLGSGKTVLASGIFRGAGLPAHVRVTSPTFTLLNVYRGPREMYHVDFYRLDSPGEAVDAGLTELWDGAVESLVVIEWFEKFPELWPREFLRIDIRITGERTRSLKLHRREDETWSRP
jgi:tRNA threonylcarbamoyladenosine biosynthesis protein TsaE